MHGGAEEAFEEVVEGREPVHPLAPERRELGGRHDDAAEGDDKEEEDGDEERREELVGRKRGDGLPEADVVQLKQYDEEEGKARRKARRIPSKHSPPPTIKVHAATNNSVRNLNKHGGRRPREPTVDLGIVLTPLENLAGVDENGLKLLDEGRADGERHEDGEEPVLEVDGLVANLVKGEAVEETRHDVQHHLAKHIIGCSPICDERTLRHSGHLREQRHGILAIILETLRRLDVLPILNHLLNLPRPILLMRRALPDIPPVLPSVIRISSTNGVKHILGRISSGGTLGAAVGLKVSDEVLAVVPEGPVVDDAAAGLEEDELVKVLKEDGGGLVDGAQDGLAGVGEFAEEAHNVEGGARVETRRGFVEEEEQLRLGGEFDADGQTLPLFLVQALANLSYGGAGDGPHFEQVDDRFTVFQLLFPWYFSRLAEKSRELKCFPNSGGRFMDIHLLCETGRSLERLGKRSTINHKVTINSTKLESLS